jgi:hypothetical protein
MYVRNEYLVETSLVQFDGSSELTCDAFVATQFSCEMRRARLLHVAHDTLDETQT